MGRIRQTAIKRTSAAIIEQEEKVPKTFNEAKEMLNKTKVFDSKRIRNRVAGYVVRLAKNKKF